MLKKFAGKAILIFLLLRNVLIVENGKMYIVKLCLKVSRLQKTNVELYKTVRIEIKTFFFCIRMVL